MSKNNNIRHNVYLNDKSAGKTMSAMRKEARVLRAEINKLEIGSKEWLDKTKQLKRVNTDMRKVNAQMRIQKNLVQRVAGGFSKYFGAIAAGAASVYALVSGFRKLTDITMEFETQMTNIKTLLSDDQISQFGDSLEESARKLIRNGHEIETVGKAMFDAISAGVDPAKIDEFNAISEKLAVGGVTELSTATDGLTSVMNAYGLTIEQTNDAADAFFSAQKEGKTTVAELSQNIGQVAPIASKLGISYQELLSSQAALTKQGISTAEATTYLKGAMTALMKPTDTASKMFEKEFGHGLGATEVKAHGFTDILSKLSILMEKYPDQMAEAVPNVRGLTAVMGLAGEGFEEYGSILQKVTTDIGENNSLSKAYTKQQQTAEQQMKRAKGEMIDLALAARDKLNPAVIMLSKGIIGFVNGMRAMSAWAQRNSATLKTIGTIIGWVTGLILTYKIAVGAMTLATKAWTAMTKGAALAQKILNTAMKLNPIGLVVTALVGLAALVYKFRKQIMGLVTRVRDWAMSFDVVKFALERLMNPIKAAIKSYQYLRSAITGVTQAERDAAKAAEEAAARRKQAMKQQIKVFDDATKRHLDNLKLEEASDQKLFQEEYNLLNARKKLLLQNKEENKEAIAETENAMLDLVRSYQKKQADEIKAAEEEKNKIKDEKNKELLAAQKKFNEDLAKLEDDVRVSQLDGAAKEYDALDKKYTEFREKAKGNKSALLKLDQLYNIEKTALDAKYTKEGEKKLHDLRKNLGLLSQDELMQDEINSIDKKLLKAEEYETAVAAIREKYRLKGEEERKKHEDAALAARKEYGLLTFEEEKALELQQLQEKLNLKLLTEEQYLQAKQNIEKYYADEQLKLDLEADKKRVESREKSFDNILQVANAAADALYSIMDNELARAGDDEEKKKQIKKKYADIGLGITASQIIANTSLAVMKALAELGPIAGPIAGALIGVSGAAQLGLAVAERQKVKAMAKGGYVDVLSDHDGRSYRAGFGSPNGGLVSKPTLFLAGETREPEYVIPGWLRRDPQVANFENIIEGKRVRGFAAGGDTGTAQAADPNSQMMLALMQENIALLRSLRAQGVKGVWEWETFKSGYNEMTSVEQDSVLS
jgi:TP901 family phage tail tape measure protein